MRKSLFNPVYDDFLKKDGFSCQLFQETFPETVGLITLPQIRSRRNLLTSGVRRKNRVKTYSENHSKRYLQDLLMRYFPIKNAKVVALLGPKESYTEYKEMLYKYVQPSMIVSWENNYDIFYDQERYNNDSKVKFMYGDVSCCNVTNYMDIDLKCTYKSCSVLINSLFERQSSLSKEKIFHFSYSVNWLDKKSVENTIINSIRDLVGDTAYISSIKDHSIPEKKISLRQYNIGGCENYIVKAFWYYDSSPMVSISIFTSDEEVDMLRLQKESYIANIMPKSIPHLSTISDRVLDLHILRHKLAA